MLNKVNQERSRLAAASSVYDSTKHNGLVTHVLKRKVMFLLFSFQFLETDKKYLFQCIKTNCLPDCSKLDLFGFFPTKPEGRLFQIKLPDNTKKCIFKIYVHHSCSVIQSPSAYRTSSEFEW